MKVLAQCEGIAWTINITALDQMSNTRIEHVEDGVSGFLGFTLVQLGRGIQEGDKRTH
jgi:hypothetical protein